MIDTILLFDRPNPTDQVTSAQVFFSDGSSLPVGALADQGTEPMVLNFPARTVSWVRFEVKSVKSGTLNAGLSEIAVFTAAPRP
jgi:hypothetical protein